MGDRRLLRRARAARTYLVATVVLGLAGVALVIAQAYLLASGIARVFLGGASLADLRPVLVGLAFVVLGRAGVAWGQEVAASRASAGVKSELREELLGHVVRLGPEYLTQARTGEIVTLTTTGLDALDAYFARYLPQVVLAGLVPLAIIGALLPIDAEAGLTIVVTVPLIPIFMVLIGSTAQRLNRRQFEALGRLTHHLLDLVSGLPTLKVFGRAKRQAEAIRDLTDRQRTLTLRTLRLAFLSSLALELLATLSVALVAVGTGLRVVDGSLDLRTALVVLILAPEAYLPLRALGTQYHASAAGVAAAAHVYSIMDTPLPAKASVVTADGAIVLEDAVVTYPGRDTPALGPISLRVEPGEVVAITGPSGCGKSTLLRLVVGSGPPGHFAYVPQHPYLFAGTIAANIDLAGTADPERIARAAADAAVDLPLETPVGAGGVGLSSGQARRVALARAFLRDAPIVALDEPTANLDPASELAVLRAVRRLAVGRTVLLVAHRPALAALADRVIPLGPAVTAGVAA
jgi:ATP-binding cassette, subfamily C, bacterial CydD